MVLIHLLFRHGSQLNVDWQRSSLTAMMALQCCSVTVSIATGVSTAADLSAPGLVAMVMFCGGRWDARQQQQQQEHYSTWTDCECRWVSSLIWDQRTAGVKGLNKSQSVVMLQWNTGLHWAACGSAASDPRNPTANCVIAPTWGEAGRPLLVATQNYSHRTCW